MKEGQSSPMLLTTEQAKSRVVSLLAYFSRLTNQEFVLPEHNQQQTVLEVFLSETERAVSLFESQSESQEKALKQSKRLI